MELKINTQTLHYTEITKMPYVTEPQKTRGDRKSGNINASSKRNTLQNHFEKMVLPPLPPRAKYQEKARVSKKSSVQPIPLKSSKPWPTSTRKDELIKHMSNVPSYLQRTNHNGDNNIIINNNNIQGKALNFGVLEWGALEKYTTTQKQRDFKSKESLKNPNLDSNLNLKFKSKKQEYIIGENGFDLCESPLKTTIKEVKYKDESFKPNLDGKKAYKEEICTDSCKSPLYIGKKQNKFSDNYTGKTPRIIPKSCPLPHDEFLKTNIIIDPLDSISGFNQLNRSSSLKERPINDKTPQSLEKINPDNNNINKRSQSPLRRMLDPLLKPKNPTFNKELNNKESGSLNVSRRSIDGFEICTNIGTGTSNYFQQEKKDYNNNNNNNSNSQGLLQIAWKNGLPLFMLSSGDSDILAATMKRKLISENNNNNNNNNQESVYSIFKVQETKKKGGVNVMWMKQGNKNKNQLVSNIIGEVSVSLLKSKCASNSQNCHLTRQFVLSSPNKQLEDSNSNPGYNEMAAIITNLPQRNCFCLKKPSVCVILPSGIHGISNSNSNSNSDKPLPLIERYKKGGGCDCGGWDEGCMLKILTNDNYNQINDSSERFELFTRGRSKEEGHAISMTCFKEGLYTVEFKSSLDLIQAFVICIGFLHGKNPMKQEIEMEEPEILVRKSVASYVPHHPPLSPVGRA